MKIGVIGAILQFSTASEFVKNFVRFSFETENKQTKKNIFFFLPIFSAGVSVSAHCAKHLLDCILQTEDFQQQNFIKGIREGFLNLDENMRTIPDLYYGVDKSGTTAVCAFVGRENIFIANCGDSRAILCRNGEPVFSTQDHKPILPGEKERIMNAGGSVMIQRVNGSLAVSRALGDYEYKNVKDKGQCEQLVSPEPEIFCLDRDPADEFLVLACDGIWDVMTNEDVCRYVQNRLRVTSDLKKVTNSVIDTCFFKVSQCSGFCVVRGFFII